MLTYYFCRNRMCVAGNWKIEESLKKKQKKKRKRRLRKEIDKQTQMQSQRGKEQRPPVWHMEKIDGKELSLVKADFRNPGAVHYAGQ